MTDGSTLPVPLTMKDIREKYRHCHPSIVNVLQLFANAHLSPALQELTYQSQKLAFIMVDNIQNNYSLSSPTTSIPELVDGLRNLLRAKDSFVRAFLLANET
jgi:hypothetical protein